MEGVSLNENIDVVFDYYCEPQSEGARRGEERSVTIWGVVAEAEATAGPSI